MHDSTVQHYQHLEKSFSATLYSKRASSIGHCSAHGFPFCHHCCLRAFQHLWLSSRSSSWLQWWCFHWCHCREAVASAVVTKKPPTMTWPSYASYSILQSSKHLFVAEWVSQVSRHLGGPELDQELLIPTTKLLFLLVSDPYVSPCNDFKNWITNVPPKPPTHVNTRTHVTPPEWTSLQQHSRTCKTVPSLVEPASAVHWTGCCP